MGIRTEKEVKQLVLAKLRELIENIENDKTSNNYSFDWELMSQSQVLPGLMSVDVRFSVRRTEYHRLQLNNEK